MALSLRISLIICSILCWIYIMRKVRKTQVSINDSIFWIATSFILVIIGVFPQIMVWGANILHIESPANFVYLVCIFILFIKSFTQSIKISQLENKLRNLTLEIALRENIDHPDD